MSEKWIPKLHSLTPGELRFHEGVLPSVSRVSQIISGAGLGEESLSKIRGTRRGLDSEREDSHIQKKHRSHTRTQHLRWHFKSRQDSLPSFCPLKCKLVEVSTGSLPCFSGNESFCPLLPSLHLLALLHHFHQALLPRLVLGDSYLMSASSESSMVTRASSSEEGLPFPLDVLDHRFFREMLWSAGLEIPEDIRGTSVRDFRSSEASSDGLAYHHLP